METSPERHRLVTLLKTIKVFIMVPETENAENFYFLHQTEDNSIIKKKKLNPPADFIALDETKI